MLLDKPLIFVAILGFCHAAVFEGSIKLILQVFPLSLTVVCLSVLPDCPFKSFCLPGYHQPPINAVDFSLHPLPLIYFSPKSPRTKCAQQYPPLFNTSLYTFGIFNFFSYCTQELILTGAQTYSSHAKNPELPFFPSTNALLSIAPEGCAIRV